MPLHCFRDILPTSKNLPKLNKRDRDGINGGGEGSGVRGVGRKEAKKSKEKFCVSYHRTRFFQETQFGNK